MGLAAAAALAITLIISWLFIEVVLRLTMIVVRGALLLLAGIVWLLFERPKRR